jgi:deazaflavin-dependent oxidoreductase (nitroreductase family)
MPLSGEYEPSRNERDRRQVEIYEATNGREGGTLNGKPVIILTFMGAKSGKIRKTPLMRIEHDGTYAVVASNGGASTHPAWYRNIISNPLVQFAGWRDHARNAGPRSLRRGKKGMVEARRRRLAGFSRADYILDGGTMTTF